jgi:hypothetical protein
MKGKQGFQEGEHPWNYGKHLSEAQKRKLRTAGCGFKKGHVPWNRGKKLASDPRYDAYRQKLSDAALASRAGSIGKDLAETPQPKGIWATIKSTFGIQ